MSDAKATVPSEKRRVEQPANANAILVLEDGTVFWGHGIGLENDIVGEVCFNTSMTGYQEIITDPSYAGQIITFTFPHIGNVGTNLDDLERETAAAAGIILKSDITAPSNYRATQDFSCWLASAGLTGIAGIDTRNLTRRIRHFGAMNGIISFSRQKSFDVGELTIKAQKHPSLSGMDLASVVSTRELENWSTGIWKFGSKVNDDGFENTERKDYHIVAIDYGAKRNILRNLAQLGAKVTTVPSNLSADAILNLQPDGIFLSNGPGDPAATAEYAVPIIRDLLNTNTPIFGICLGHQLLSLALGAKTEKMKNGHRGGNHPVKQIKTGRIEITSQNHGFVISEQTLPESATITHRSLFDGSIEGFEIAERNIFSVQYHPEASPGPTESDYLFRQFLEIIKKARLSDNA
jgi:carbamoyl-phosphate synthase small subunit